MTDDDLVAAKLSGVFLNIQMPIPWDFFEQFLDSIQVSLKKKGVHITKDDLLHNSELVEHFKSHLIASFTDFNDVDYLTSNWFCETMISARFSAEVEEAKKRKRDERLQKKKLAESTTNLVINKDKMDEITKLLTEKGLL